MRYNIEQLLNDATGYNVAEYIGMEIRQKGSYKFILCPSHMEVLGKHDSTMTNCILTKKGFRCFACGAEKNVIDMVLDYYKYELGTPITFANALAIIGDSLGGRELYAKSGNDDFDADAFSISSSDLNFLGLSMTYTYENMRNSGKDLNQKDPAYKHKTDIDYKESGRYIYYTKDRISIAEIAKRNPAFIRNLIAACAKEKMERYADLLSKYGSREASQIRELLPYFKNNEIDNEVLKKIKTKWTDAYHRAAEIYSEYSEDEKVDEEKKEETKQMTVENAEESEQEKRKRIKESNKKFYEMFG